MTIVLIGLVAITLLAVGGIVAVIWSVVTCQKGDEEHPAAPEGDTTAQTVANVIIAYDILD